MKSADSVEPERNIVTRFESLPEPPAITDLSRYIARIHAAVSATRVSRYMVSLSAAVSAIAEQEAQFYEHASSLRARILSGETSVRSCLAYLASGCVLQQSTNPTYRNFGVTVRLSVMGLLNARTMLGGTELDSLSTKIWGIEHQLDNYSDVIVSVLDNAFMDHVATYMLYSLARAPRVLAPGATRFALVRVPEYSEWPAAYAAFHWDEARGYEAMFEAYEAVIERYHQLYLRASLWSGRTRFEIGN